MKERRGRRALRLVILRLLGAILGYTTSWSFHVTKRIMFSADEDYNTLLHQYVTRTLLINRDGAATGETRKESLRWRPDHKPPRRFFASPNGSSFYAEPNVGTDGYGDFERVPRYPYNMEDIVAMNVSDPAVVSHIQQTIQHRLMALLKSDASSIVNWSEGGRSKSLPTFLPPQFPQRDRSVSASLQNATYIGFPPSCCPKIDDKKVINASKEDCTCRSPTNYPTSWPDVTIVTALYQFPSKHSPNEYMRWASQIVQTSDPMIIFVEPDSDFEKFFMENRQHAPTMIVPRPLKDLVCANTFDLNSFWKEQHDRLNPERTTYHEKVSLNLFALWCEKLVLVEAIARLNPFNTSVFAYVDAGMGRQPLPHLWRRSIINDNWRDSKVVEEHAILFYQVREYRFDERIAYRPTGNDGPKTIVTAGSSYVGTPHAIDNYYSSYYDVFWSMALEDLFVGDDQCVNYRTCHTYPSSCHIHTPKTMREWMEFLLENGPLDKIEKITGPLALGKIEPRPVSLPVPPVNITFLNLPLLNRV